MIHQRELGRDVSSFAYALHSALREDPDIILVGEMRDFETISAAITATETGHLVLSTLHTQSAAQTINRIIDGSPIDLQATIQSGSLQGMHTLNNDLQRFVSLGLISRKTAMDAAYDPNELEKLIGVTNYGF